MMDIEELNDLVYELTDRSLLAEQDNYPVAGLASWAYLSVNAESDWTLNIGRLDDGTVVAAEGYGPQDLLKKGTTDLTSIFTEDKVYYFVSESPNFIERCADYSCDNEDKVDCPEHVNHNFPEVWNLLNKHVLSRYM